MDDFISSELLEHQPLERRFHVSHPYLVTFPGFLKGWSVVDIHRGDAHPRLSGYVAEDCVVEKRITPQHTIVVVTYRPRGDSEMSETTAASTSVRCFTRGGTEITVKLNPHGNYFELCIGDSTYHLHLDTARAMHGLFDAHFGLNAPDEDSLEALRRRGDSRRNSTTTEENPVQTQEFCSPSISPWRRWLDRISNTLSILLVAGGCGALGYFTEWYMAVAPPALGVVAWAAAKLIRRRWGFYEQRFKCANCRKCANFRCAKGQRLEDGVMKCPVCGMKCRLRPGLNEMELVD